MDKIMEKITAIVSNKLLKKGISLTSLGINEIAWAKDDIKKIMEELGTKKIGILGGDVYRIDGEKIKITCDGWYMNDDDSEKFYQNSREKALNYIEDYERNNRGKFIYTIVI